MKRFITIALAALALMVTMTACAHRGNVNDPNRDNRGHDGHRVDRHRRDGVLPRDGVIRDDANRGGMRRDGVARDRSVDGNTRGGDAGQNPRVTTPNNPSVGAAPMATVPTPKTTVAPAVMPSASPSQTPAVR
ncbi:MAG: hypothetical protein FWE06_02020 [Oscillospiraceae bacterium]|nr:hypothetical protein [Oscillospiraceae bacterium]